MKRKQLAVSFVKSAWGRLLVCRCTYTTAPQVVSDRREAKSHMEVLANSTYEEFPERIFGLGETCGFDSWTNRVENLVLVFWFEEISDVSGGEEVVDVDEEVLVCDLGFAEEKDDPLVLQACSVVQKLQAERTEAPGDCGVDKRRVAVEGGRKKKERKKEGERTSTQERKIGEKEVYSENGENGYVHWRRGHVALN